MNKLVSCSFFQQDKDICDNCGMENDGEFNGCCKEVKLKVKNDNDQFKSFVSILFEKIELHHHRGFYTCAPEVKIIFSVRKFADNGPPGLITIPLFILNKVILV